MYRLHPKLAQHIFDHQSNAQSVRQIWDEIKVAQPSLSQFLREVLSSLPSEKGALVLHQIALFWFFVKSQGTQMAPLTEKGFDEIQRAILKNIDDKESPVPFHRLQRLLIESIPFSEESEKALNEICFRTLGEALARSTGQSPLPIHEEWEIELLWKIVSQAAWERVDSEFTQFKERQPELIQAYVNLENPDHRRAVVFFHRFFTKHYGEVPTVFLASDRRELFYPHQELYLTVFPSWFAQRASENLPLNGLLRSMASAIQLTLPSGVLAQS